MSTISLALPLRRRDRRAKSAPLASLVAALGITLAAFGQAASESRYFVLEHTGYQGRHRG